ncbi:hypothetical protein A5750_07185 [Mycobacterium sp. 852002-51613_SCH5001154]|uniref:hypothetical protein n=1 Tax=Mycobacterium sp. 852002-51613_SCH5001154 TaxID=1834104 RepID=UPI0007FC517B|nr:hypothetical protein [Mycobacterium sp. 852002-51613_SCH5001154]OBF77178.1 hypothetical protein A5750_07185 [Mycobacterium sp. 852002-51613_SCH5001154]
MNKLLVLVDRLRRARRRGGGDRAVGVGTVRTVERQVFIEVVAVSGETFIGKLARCGDDLDVSMLRPGLVVLVAFDPAAREELSLPDDVLAVHAAFVASL